MVQWQPWIIAHPPLLDNGMMSSSSTGCLCALNQKPAFGLALAPFIQNEDWDKSGLLVSPCQRPVDVTVKASLTRKEAQTSSHYLEAELKGYSKI